MTPDQVADAIEGDVLNFILSDRRSGEMIELGDLRRRRRPINNSALSDTEREFEGEHSLFIQCKWVLDSLTVLEIPSGRGPFDSAGVLHSLMGQEIRSANISPDSLELSIALSGGATLTADPRTKPNPDLVAYTVRLDCFYWSAYGSGEYREDEARPESL